jgi:hypothetical protein
VKRVVGGKKKSSTKRKSPKIQTELVQSKGTITASGSPVVISDLVEQPAHAEEQTTNETEQTPVESPLVHYQQVETGRVSWSDLESENTEFAHEAGSSSDRPSRSCVRGMGRVKRVPSESSSVSPQPSKPKKAR